MAKKQSSLFSLFKEKSVVAKKIKRIREEWQVSFCSMFIGLYINLR